MLGFRTPRRAALAEVTNSPSYVSPTANLRLLTNVALHNPRQRKEKSLKILCDRFLELYPLYGLPVGCEIHLDATAQSLGVEKRRIYDIINILEALQCAAHCRKNTYAWYGGSRLRRFLDSLRPRPEPKSPRSRAAPKRRSLGKLAQRFLTMFLAQPPDSPVNLEMAVAALIRPEQSDEPSDALLKSKVRRLYDIANVLTSIGLIEKVSDACLKKPVFRYVGPDATTPTPSALLTPDSTVRRARLRTHASKPFRSKRKLEFELSTPPPEGHSPPTTPPVKVHKWNQILHVAGMELHRINAQKCLADRY